MSDERWMQTCERLRSAIQTAMESHLAMADQLDIWARQSKEGGWSTHQVDPMRAKADDLRRQAALLRSELR